MSKEKAVIGVIGCGKKACSAHIPALEKLENVNLKYLSDINTQRLRELKEEYPQCETFADYRDMLSCADLDGVVICTHTNLHCKIAKEFLLRGVDVFTEKPVAMNYEEALETARIARENGRVFDAGVCLRFASSLEKVRNIVQSGEIGNVYHVSCRFRFSKSIPGAGSDYTKKSKSGGGVLIDLGVHNFDAIDYCLGGVKWKSAFGKCISSPLMASGENSKAGYTAGSEIKSDVEDYAFGIAQSHSGITLSFEGSWAQNIGDEEKYIDFLGDKGAVRFNYYRGYTLWGKGGEKLKECENCYDGKMYENELESFADDILKRRFDSRNAVENVLSSAQLIDMIYASSGK